MDATKVKMYDDAVNSGGEMTYRYLIQSALEEGNEDLTSWLIDKAKSAHGGSFKDIIEEAVTGANAESATQKPTDLAKKYWIQTFPDSEEARFIQNPDGTWTDKPTGTTAKTRDELSDLMAEQHKSTAEHEAADKIKDTIKSVVSNARKLTPDGVPEDDDHWGEEQAAGLAEILNGLREGPNDNRW